MLRTLNKFQLITKTAWTNYNSEELYCTRFIKSLITVIEELI